jgi:hypothetical protein
MEVKPIPAPSGRVCRHIVRELAASNPSKVLAKGETPHCQVGGKHQLDPAHRDPKVGQKDPRLDTWKGLPANQILQRIQTSHPF